MKKFIILMLVVAAPVYGADSKSSVPVRKSVLALAGASMIVGQKISAQPATDKPDQKADTDGVMLGHPVCNKKLLVAFGVNDVLVKGTYVAAPGKKDENGADTWIYARIGNPMKCNDYILYGVETSQKKGSMYPLDKLRKLVTQ